MKPQDLRIGNYVRIKCGKVIIRVEAITKHKIGFHYNVNKTRTYYRNYSEIEPVLIREVYDSLPYIKDLEWCGRYDGDICYCYEDVVITYLHELQNIHYIFTGNEIEIEI